MCVRYFIAICEKDFISLWILELRICRSWRCVVVVVWTVACIPTMIIIVVVVMSTPVGIGVDVE